MNEYRPRLEKLAYELEQTRIERTKLDKNIKDLSDGVKKELDSLGLKEYEGSVLVQNVKLIIMPSYNIKPRVALNYFRLETLLEIGAIEVNKEKFEKHLKKVRIELDKKEYLTAKGSHERVAVKLKK